MKLYLEIKGDFSYRDENWFLGPDDIKRVGTVWFSEKDKAFSDHLTSLAVALGKHPRIQSEYATLSAKPTEQRPAWLSMLLVNA